MIRVAIVEDDAIVRQSLTVILDATEGFRCVGAYPTCEEFLASYARNKPDVTLMDIQIKGGMSGIDGVRKLRALDASAIVLMQTVFQEDDKIFDALCAGASGYLLKKTSPARLLEAIAEAREGGSPMSPGVARKVIDHFRASKSPADESVTLSDREKEVLRQLESGKPYKAVAEELHISVPTVRFHMGNIYRKLHASSQSEAISKAVRKGLI